MDNRFPYVGDTLYCERIDLAELAARVGTPTYVYSSAAILDRYRAYDESFGDAAHRVCYAVKANSNVGLLRLLVQAGSWFDIVSGGELYRVLRAGGKADRVVYSGVGKTPEEIDYALSEGIHTFNCESEQELALIDSLAARRGAKARVAIRVNPDVDATTHPYISTGLREHKFGIDMEAAESLCERSREMENISLEGISCHIGSQLLKTDPIIDAADIVLRLVERLRGKGFSIQHVDLGGGLGIAYEADQVAPEIGGFVRAILNRAAAAGVTVMVEPGRSIVGDAGMLLSRVLYRKQNESKEFVIVDASMTDLMRPALYQSHHEILPVRKGRVPGRIVADVVGPVCESGDFLARGREMDNAMPGDLLAVCSAGAYGFVMASNYNSRPRPAEVLVEGETFRVVRERETYEDLVRGEV